MLQRERYIKTLLAHHTIRDTGLSVLTHTFRYISGQGPVRTYCDTQPCGAHNRNHSTPSSRPALGARAASLFRSAIFARTELVPRPATSAQAVPSTGGPSRDTIASERDGDMGSARQRGSAKAARRTDQVEHQRLRRGKRVRSLQRDYYTVGSETPPRASAAATWAVHASAIAQRQHAEPTRRHGNDYDVRSPQTRLLQGRFGERHRERARRRHQQCTPAR